MRVTSIDAFRGFATLLMIFVDQVGHLFPNSIGHSAWNGLHVADFVMPAFLFIVGCAIGIVSARPSSRAKSRAQKLGKICMRTAKLFLLGVATQGVSLHDAFFNGYNLSTLRICGILQRIAVAYFVVAAFDLVKCAQTDGATTSVSTPEASTDEEGQNVSQQPLLEPTDGSMIMINSNGFAQLKEMIVQRKPQWAVMAGNLALFLTLTFATPVGTFHFEDAVRNLSVKVECHHATLDPVRAI